MQKRLLQLSEFFGKYLRYGAAAMLIAIPLYPKFPFITIPGSQVSVRLEDFLIFIVGLMWFFVILPNYKKLLKDRINQAILLFFIIGLISLFSGAFVTFTISLPVAIFHWARRVEYLLAFLIGREVVKSRDDLIFFIKIITFVVISTFLFGLGQKYLNWPVITTQNVEYSKGVALRYRPGSHLVSTFAGHYDLATYVILTIPILLSFAASSKKVINQLRFFSSTLLTRVYLASVFSIGLWLLINAASRISIASYLLAVTISLLFVRRYLLIPVVLAFSIIFTSMSSNLMDRYMSILDVSLRKIMKLQVDSNLVVGNAHAQEFVAPERRESDNIVPPPPIPVFEDRSTSIRLNVEWPRAIRALTKNPLLGTGYSSISLATDNGYLRLLGEIGILGTATFALLLFRTFKELFRNVLKKAPKTVEEIYVASIIGALAGVLMNMVFIDVLEASKFATMFWILVGFAVAAKSIPHGQNN